MDAKQLPGGSLLLTYDSTRWSKWLSGGAIVMALTAAYDLTLGTRGDDRLVGLFGGIATCIVGAIAMYETSRFHADVSTGSIKWDRRWAFQHRSGRIDFAEVSYVGTERPIGDTGVPSRRVMLHLTNGELVPVTVGYRPDVGDEITTAAELLRRTIGHDAVPSPDASLRALVAGGRKIEAIKLLVEEQQLSLADAKATVDRVHEDIKSKR